MSDQEAVLRLWAKTNQGSGNNRFHPLLCHMLDAAAVAGLVWDHHFTLGLHKRLEYALGNEARTRGVNQEDSKTLVTA